MKIDLNQPLYELNGNEVKDFDLKKACVDCLMLSDPEEKVDGQTKLERYTLGLVINKGGEVDLTAEQITKLKERVGKYANTIIVGQVYELLEGKNNSLAPSMSK